MKPVCAMLLLFAAGALLPACDRGKGPAGEPTRSVPDAPDNSAAPPPAPGARLTEFFFYRASAGGVEQRPSFVMRTPAVSITAQGEALLEEVEAEIHGRDDEVTTIRAQRGRFDQQAKTATMEGAVTLERGTMRVEMQDLVWLDEERVARTEKPVHILDAGAELSAENLEFYPDEGALVLTNLAGGVTLAGRTEP
ncbi:MAG TPA: LPS export ABC transporter periplasmic protein LptC [Candidatus Hydrogenedentes bacterium]|jgi:lipopolysaccharide assembly outer membrane protein LptD (OstA)|nr:LPS export ABC transporter periplasmic protein LptC [Candidatus Hydrogenedentota bacterium]